MKTANRFPSGDNGVISRLTSSHAGNAYILCLVVTQPFLSIYQLVYVNNSAINPCVHIGWISSEGHYVKVKGNTDSHMTNTFCKTVFVVSGQINPRRFLLLQTPHNFIVSSFILKLLQWL